MDYDGADDDGTDDDGTDDDGTDDDGTDDNGDDFYPTSRSGLFWCLCGPSYALCLSSYSGEQFYCKYLEIQYFSQKHNKSFFTGEDSSLKSYKYIVNML